MVEVDDALRKPLQFIQETCGVGSTAELLLSALPCFSPNSLPLSLLLDCANSDERAVNRLVEVGILREEEGLGDAEDVYYSVPHLLHKSLCAVLTANVRHAAEKLGLRVSLFCDRDPRTWTLMRDLVIHGMHLYEVAM
eukprot:3767534-Prorocentrum_lima.AAC.1